MRQSKRSKRKQPAKSIPTPSSPGSRRGKIAILLALLTAVATVLTFWLAGDTRFLMPGPLASAHVAIENCSACHTDSGNSQLSWIKGLASADPLSDSKACLSCHQMPNTALNPHGTTNADLKQRTDRLVKVAASTPVPQSAHAQNAVFPIDDMVARGLNCASCHQEHLGAEFDLKKVADDQCRACHVVKFDSFDGEHPPFSNYPFKRRTRIIYDHDSHFNKHFPEVAKKNPQKRRPATCKTCHDSGKDKRVMSVTSFDNTCATCHLDQITGKERVSGPKGVAFLSLPGLDVQTLRQKKAKIGEWPEESEATLTPFMKMVIGRNEKGRALIRTVQAVDLQDLTKANDAQIKAVTSLVWEIKGMFYKLIKGKASDVLADLRIDGKAKLSPTLVAELTASMPRDVVVRAHQQWLPNLAAEIAVREGRSVPRPPGWSNTKVTPKPEAGAPSPAAAEPADSQPEADGSSTPAPETPPDVASAPEDSSETDPAQESPSEANKQPENVIKENPQDCVFSIFGQCLATQGANPQSGTNGRIGNANANFLGGRELAPPTNRASPGKRLGIVETEKKSRPIVLSQAPAKSRPGGASKQDDKLLFPTPEELRALGPRAKEIGNPGQKVDIKPNAAAARPAPATAAQDSSPPSGEAPAAASASNVPALIIQSDVDPETWAEYGGWYQQDYAVFYRPKGHKDKFMYSWLVLTASQAVQGRKTPAADLFGSLTSKDAQGSCTKCHSVDTIQAKRRAVNFAPASVKTKQGNFTKFIHEPHFSIMDDRGCLTCHTLEKGRPYLKSYEQGDPRKFTSNFNDVKIKLCQGCHTSEKSRQDCLLCHTYHVNGVVTPTIDTKIPAQ